MYTSITSNGLTVKEKMIENYYILNQIVQTIDTGILIIFDRRLLYVNNETRRITQRAYRDIELHLLDGVLPQYRRAVLKAYISVLRNYCDRSELFVELVLPLGGIKMLRCRFSRIKIMESEGIFVTLHDWKDTNDTRNFSRPLSLLWRRFVEDYDKVFSRPYDFVIMLDDFYIITNIGLKFEKVTGYRRYNFVGKRIDSLPGLTPYFEILQILRDCKDVAATGRVARNVNVKIKSKSGSILKFMMSIMPIGYRGVTQKLCIIAKCEGEEAVSEIPSVDVSSEVPNLEGKIIIVAEDADINFILLKKILEKTKATILRACNGKECVEVFKKNPNVSLILMDMQMPEMDGYQASQIILSIDKTVPIIAQTAFGLPDDREKIMSIGCVDFVTKPIVRNSLYQKIRAVIR